MHFNPLYPTSQQNERFIATLHYLILFFLKKAKKYKAKSLVFKIINVLIEDAHENTLLSCVLEKREYIFE